MFAYSIPLDGQLLPDIIDASRVSRGLIKLAPFASTMYYPKWKLAPSFAGIIPDDPRASTVAHSTQCMSYVKISDCLTYMPGPTVLFSAT